MGEPPASEDGPAPLPPGTVTPAFDSGPDRAQRRMLFAVRLVYMVLLVTVALLPFVGTVTQDSGIRFTEYAGAFVLTFLFGAAVLVIDAATPNKKLASVFGIYLGIIAGLVGALAIGTLLDLVAQSWDLSTNPWVGEQGLVKIALGITLCYLAVSIVLTTKDDFRLVIPYVEFAKQVRGVRPMVLDTSALIDGRIEAVARTGFLDAPLVVPRFVIQELQRLADSADRTKRDRGRRGLDMVSTLQNAPQVDVTIDPSEASPGSVDHALIRLAAEQKFRILTTDSNLNKVAKIQGVPVLNLNDVANTLRPQVQPGDVIRVDVTKRGEAADQGVGYLADGTMVVIERGVDLIGAAADVIVTNALQTSAGRMIFARPQEEFGATADEPRDPERLVESAVRQPRATEPPSGRPGRSKRNPRR